MNVPFLSFASVVLCLAAFGSADPDFLETSEPELRLRLEDRMQELRTTSVNWSDLKREKAATSLLSLEHPLPLPETRKLKVQIDAGHGGRDLGALGWHAIVEKELCLKLAGLVKRELQRLAKKEQLQIEIQMSRTTDHFVALRDRVRQANDWGADLFISLHANSSEHPRARGFEVYFLSNEATDAEASRVARLENQGQKTEALKPGVLSILSDVQTNLHVHESSDFAESIYQSMARRLRSNGRGVRQAPFTVLHGTRMPALLVEIGYVTNEEEAGELSKVSYLKRIAGAISTGIVEFATQVRKLI